MVEQCLPLPGLSRNGISLTSSFSARHSRTTALKKRQISSWGHDGGPVSSRRACPADDFSLCFQLSCLFFVFCFCFVFAFVYFLPLLLFSFPIFYSSFCCLSFHFFPLSPRHTNMASRQIHRTPKVVLFSFFLRL